MIRDYIAAHYPEEAERLRDFISTTISTTIVGLSAKALHGYNLDRFLDSARLASQAIALTLPA